MKGKIVLIPVDKPVEGVKYMFLRTTTKKWITCSLYKSQEGIPNSTDVRISEDEQPSIGLVPLSELHQIAIEYEGEWLPKELLNPGERVYTTKKTLPLLSTDWEYAIKHIGEEVEFREAVDGLYDGTDDIGTFAKLILPSPVMYTEEAVAEFFVHMCNETDPYEYADGDPEVLKSYIRDYYSKYIKK